MTDLSSNNLGEIADSVETVSTETTEEVEEIIVEQPESESETEVTLDNVDIEVNGDHDNDADTNFGVDNTIEIDMVEISNNGDLMAYRHEDFWQCMDNVRERDYLDKLIRSKAAPWIKW